MRQMAGISFLESMQTEREAPAVQNAREREDLEERETVKAGTRLRFEMGT